MSIPEEVLTKIKRDVSIVRLVEARGIMLTGHGDNLVGLCPLHDDKTPSLIVSPAKNLWHCMGKCQTGGSVIDWVMKVERVSFRLAVEMLRKNAAGLAELGASHTRRAPIDQIAEPDGPDMALMLRVLGYYHATLKESPEALAYLDGRGLNHAEMIDRFHLGYANRTLTYRLPSKNTKSGAALREQLQRIGIYRASGHEHFAGSIVFPIINAGQVHEIYGRKVRTDLHKDVPLHLYMPARPSGRGVFNLEAIEVSSDIILCEAIIDALTFWCTGFRNVTSAYGVEGFTAEIAAAFKRHRTAKVLIAYDRDAAGDRAAEKLAKELGTQGLEVFRVLFPRGMDANEYAKNVRPAAKAFEAAIRGATWMAGTRPVAVAGALTGRIIETSASLDEDPAITSEATPPITDTSASLDEPRAASNEASTSLGERPHHVGEASTTLDDGRPSSSTSLEETSATLADARTMIRDASATLAEARRSTGAADLNAAGATSGPRGDLADPLPLAAERTAQASPADAPRPNKLDLKTEVRGEEIRIDLGDRRWRIRGLAKNTSYESLRLNLLVARKEAFFVDTLELYSARQRAAFLKEAAAELKLDELTLKSDLGRIVLHLEDLVHDQITRLLHPTKKVEMSKEEREEALALLRDPRLFERILEDFDRAGVVGEENNKLLGYLAAVSRKLEAPLAVVLQSSSAAGKSSLMDAVLRFMPEEERVQYSAMTGQSLFYMGETDLAHKILAIAEEEGAESATYALKLLQSEGELTIASTGKDATTGKLVTHQYRVQGPVMIFLTTTAIEVDEELLNRCLVLTVDEGPKQTSAIHDRQRQAQTLEGLLARRERDGLLRRHKNAQRLLEPLFVANPFAKSLRFASHSTRTRRDHMKYLTLIRAIALLQQHQRPIKEVEHNGDRVRYIEVTAHDLELADRLTNVVMKNCLDVMPPQTRQLLADIELLVAKLAKEQGIEETAVRFTRRQVREHTRLSLTQLRVHIGRLEELEYLLVHAGGGRRRFVYELSGEVPNGGRNGGTAYDPILAGGKAQLAGSWRGYGGGAHRQENGTHFNGSADLGGGLEKALLAGVRKC